MADRPAHTASGSDVAPAAFEPDDVAAERTALRRVAALAAAGGSPEAVFAAVALEGPALLGGALMSLARYEGDGTYQVILAETGGHVTVGSSHPTTIAANVSARIWRSHEPERIDDVAAVPDVLQGAGNVRACVAVPVVVDGSLWGSLAVCSCTEPLPLVAEDRLTAFAEIVAAAIVSAAARTSMQALADEQAASLRVAALVAQGAVEGAIFNAVAVEAAALIGDEHTTLARYEGRRTFTVLATRDGPAEPGTRYTVPVDDAGPSAEMLRTLKPARQKRCDTIADQSLGQGQLGPGPSVSVPIMVQGRLWGALVCRDAGRRLPTETEGRLVTFAELVGPALANVEARAELERFGREQAALRRVATLAASGVPYASVLRAIVTEVSTLFEVAAVSVGQYGRSGRWLRIGVAGGPTAEPSEPTSAPDEEAVAQEVLATGRPARVEDDPSPVDLHDDRRLLLCSGVPIRLEGETWGALVATAVRRPLPSGSETCLMQFTHIAATAVDGARSRDSLGRLAKDQSALRRVAELIASGAPLDEVFDAVATEASNILGKTTTGLFRYDADGFATLVARCRCSAPLGVRLAVDPAAVYQQRGRVRFATLVGTPYAALVRDFGAGEVVAAPIVVEGQFWGGFTTSTPGEPLSAEAGFRLEEFAGLAAAAVASAENRAKLRASRARLVVMANETRQRLQRDVHDGAQQRLVQTVLTLKLGLDLAARGEDPVELMREALENAERATVELRDLVHGILPASLSRGGLRTGIESLIAGLSVPVDLDVAGLADQRLPTDLEVTAYFIVAEALTNVVKYAEATRVGVSLAADAGVLTIEVVDDGRGGADRHGSGLTGLADRVDAMSGSLLLTSPPGGGTTVRVALPCL